jgi:pimeloyl-ACP methyl ester carboxylesterase
MLNHAEDVLAELGVGTGEEFSLEEIATITERVTIVVGSRSIPMFERQARKLADAMLGAEVVTIEGVGHAMMLDAPQPVADAIIAADTAPPSSAAG